MTAVQLLTHDRINPERNRAAIRERLLRSLGLGSAFSSRTRTSAIADAADLVTQLVARRRETRERSQSLEARAGLTEGHVGKIEAGRRVPGIDTFALLVRAMGGRIVIIWDRETG